MKPQRFILAALLALMGLAACQKEKRLHEVEALFDKGVEQRAAKQSEAAAESFGQALLALEGCDLRQPETQWLKGQIEDNLGFCYWKHELFEEALSLHEDAAALFRSLNADTLLMTALRNCGRAEASLGNIEEAKTHYEEALTIAKALNDRETQKRKTTNNKTRYKQ